MNYTNNNSDNRIAMFRNDRQHAARYTNEMGTRDNSALPLLIKHSQFINLALLCEYIICRSCPCLKHVLYLLET